MTIHNLSLCSSTYYELSVSFTSKGNVRIDILRAFTYFKRMYGKKAKLSPKEIFAEVIDTLDCRFL